MTVNNIAEDVQRRVIESQSSIPNSNSLEGCVTRGLLSVLQDLALFGGHAKDELEAVRVRLDVPHVQKLRKKAECLLARLTLLLEVTSNKCFGDTECPAWHLVR